MVESGVPFKITSRCSRPSFSDSEETLLQPRTSKPCPMFFNLMHLSFTRVLDHLLTADQLLCPHILASFGAASNLFSYPCRKTGGGGVGLSLKDRQVCR